jgi:hypothetical protein
MKFNRYTLVYIVIWYSIEFSLDLAVLSHHTITWVDFKANKYMNIHQQSSCHTYSCTFHCQCYFVMVTCYVIIDLAISINVDTIQLISVWRLSFEYRVISSSHTAVSIVSHMNEQYHHDRKCNGKFSGLFMYNRWKVFFFFLLFIF